VLFYELITLHYYLRPVETLVDRLAAILTEEPLAAIQMHHRYGAPPELAHFARAGLAKDPDERYQSVDEMIDKLQAVINGQIPVVCPCTGAKRAAHRYGDFLNLHPILGIAGICILFLLALIGLLDVGRMGLSLHRPRRTQSSFAQWQSKLGSESGTPLPSRL
jgi:hypothetical protein